MARLSRATKISAHRAIETRYTWAGIVPSVTNAHPWWEALLVFRVVMQGKLNEEVSTRKVRKG